MEILFRAEAYTVKVFVRFARQKSIRLTFYSPLDCRLSAPLRTPRGQLLAFLEENAGFLARTCHKYEKTFRLEDFFLKKQVTLLGKAYPLFIGEGRPNVTFLESGITVMAPAGGAEEVFRSFWRKQALSYLQLEVLRQQQALGLDRQITVQVRKMKARWGSCHVKEGKVLFSEGLFMAPLAAVSYVVLHELVHFYHPDHQKGFYQCLEQIMPDWKKARALLKEYALR